MSGPLGSSQWMYNTEYYDYKIGYSCRFNRPSNHHLTRTFASGGNRRTWTFSLWIKPTKWDDYNSGAGLSGAGGIFGQFNNNSNTADLTFSGDAGRLQLYDYISGYRTNLGSTTRHYRDTSAWYHIMAVMDSTQGTAANRAKVFVNGENIVGDLTTTVYPDQNLEGLFNNADDHAIGKGNGAYHSDSYMAEIHFVDGIALDASSFGEAGDFNDWKPKEYTGSHGTTGFYLDFSNSSNLGEDQSGNDNDWTVQNLNNSHDQMLDTPTNKYCTLNNNDWQYKERSGIMTEGLLRCWDSSSDWTHAVGNMIIPKNKKIYYEVLAVDQSFYAGIALATENAGAYSHGSRPDGGWIKGLCAAYTSSNTAITVFRATIEGTPLGTQNFGSLSNVHQCIVGIAIDQGAADVDDRIKFYINNSLAADNLNPSNCINPGSDHDYVPIVAGGGNNLRQVVNFGQDSSFAGQKTAQGNGGDGEDFYYTPPAGYVALCSKNLPTPIKPQKNFSTTLYSGDGNSTHAITGVGFRPDFLWIKNRNGTAGHTLQDVCRTADAYLGAETDEGENATRAYVNSFDADGFTTGNASGASKGPSNASGSTYVAWSWLAGGDAGSSNTDGSINTTTTTVNSAAGFSISTYTGTGSAATIGHGLSLKPALIIVKKRNASGDWMVLRPRTAGYVDNTDYGRLNTTHAFTDSNNAWNDTEPTATVWTAGSDGAINGSGNTYVAYCWHNVTGYSKFGIYQGYASTDGTFVECGFQPAYVMLKALTGTEQWWVYDNKRDTTNIKSNDLNPDGNDAEAAQAETLDFLSNGFKLKVVSGARNNTGQSYLFMAFAHSPGKFTNAH